MNLFAGVDNGADGAIVAIDVANRVRLQEIAPVVNVGTAKGGKKRIPNPQRMVAIMRELIVMAGGPRNVRVVLEKAQAYPKEGAVASFNYGRGYGAWEGVLAALDVPYDIVDPKAWQKVELAGIEGTDTKARALLKAQRSLIGFEPILPRCRVAHGGLPDAACMSMHSQRLWSVSQPAITHADVERAIASVPKSPPPPPMGRR